MLQVRKLRAYCLVEWTISSTRSHPKLGSSFILEACLILHIDRVISVRCDTWEKGGVGLLGRSELSGGMLCVCLWWRPVFIPELTMGCSSSELSIKVVYELGRGGLPFNQVLPDLRVGVVGQVVDHLLDLGGSLL